MVKNLPARQETQVQSLGQEDPLEKGMATHSSILEKPTDRGAWWAVAHAVAESQTRLGNWTHTYRSYRQTAGHLKRQEWL